MEVKSVREGDGMVVGGGAVGEGKQIPRLRLGMTKVAKYETTFKLAKRIHRLQAIDGSSYRAIDHGRA